MKFLIFTFLAILATSFANDDACEVRAKSCVESLLRALVSDSEEEVLCKELRTSIDCAKNVVEDCLGDESREEIEDGLKQLEKLNEDCGGSQESVSDDEHEEIGKCFEENEDYIHECITEGNNKAFEILLSKDDVNEDTLKCTIYGMMAECFVERVGEKCGETAARMAREELSTVPVEIRDACEAAGSIETLDIQLLDKKK